MPPVNTPVVGFTLASFVPSVVFVKVTFAPLTKPVPVIVTSVVVGGAPCVIAAGATVVTDGAAFTVMAPASVPTPLSSVTVML
jgi:hypothetical protein